MSTAIIIGAGPGLGFALAQKFGQKGFAIALLARSEDNLKAFAQTLSEQGITTSTHAVDITDFSALRQTLRAIAQKDTVEVVIYNAVKKQFNSPLELDVEEMVDAYRMDVAGALLSVQTILPFMQENDEGTFLFTGGGAALHRWMQAPTISIAKAGIRSLAFMLAEELKESPIQVGTITIFGTIKENTAFDPNKIAAVYYQHYQQGVPEVEVQFKG
ncbi:SDR family NAD(P)-dependent oxidoreductase [Lewinella sp. LCG006]|uniref:SDR family NAD(P)-dependent oxidoreductase n=1 Tax=Lewinella sp. LCG006 TaxID=3231911 RepID=UPI0034611312